VLAAVVITVLTMSPGGDVFARFGHTAILVEDEAGARVYNFGAYKGSDPNIVSQFLHNAIPYYLSVNEIDRFVWKYRDREVIGQQLALTNVEAQAMAERLATKALPENRNYKYDWFRNNCTTKTRDAVDEALGGAWRKQLAGAPARRHPTLRTMLLDALWTVPTVATVMSLTLNARADAPLDAWQELAMPPDLMQGLREARRPDGRPVVAEEWRWIGPSPPPLRQPRWTQPLAEALLLYLLIVGAFARGRWARVAGGAGLCLWGGLSLLLSLWFVFWTIIPYPDGRLSVNMLGYSPLAVLFIADGVRILERRAPGPWARRAAILIVALIVLGLAVSRQHHLRYALYALAALAGSYFTARAAARALPSA
jgi:Domain of unknown function (DUF4105)